MLNKMKIQINMLVCIMTFIWEVTLATACHIYSAVIRPALAHGAAAWHTDPDVNRLKMTCWSYKNELVKKLVKMQNKCLWIITNIYKIMLITVLETETYTFLLDLYLNTRLVSFCQQHKKSDMKEMIRKTCKKIQRQFYHDNISKNLIINKRQLY